MKDSYSTNLTPSLEVLSEVTYATTSADTFSPCKNPRECARVFVLSAEGDIPSNLGWSRAELDASGFTFEAAKTLTIPSPDGSRNVAVGIELQDQADDFQDETDCFRAAGAAAANCTRKAQDLRFEFADETNREDVTEFLVGYLLARYELTTHKSAPSDPADAPVHLREVALVAPGLDEGEVAQVFQRAAAYARAGYVARDLTNASPGHLNPSTFPAIAEKLGDDFGFGVRIYDLPELQELGCGGIVGVNRGSEHAAHLIRLDYAPREAAEEETQGEVHRLALVGKGITFDSGGLSLKPSTSMLEMKMDMGGAAAILGAFSAFVDLGVKIPVSAWLPITDNMVSGNALRVGEVITARNGKTVEVMNTDAEGRLVLMDALALAVEEEPTWLVDIATLTGAQVVALGNEVAAVIGNDDELIEDTLEAAAGVGEELWQLPLYKRYLKIMDSEVADIANANMSNRSAGTITASLFLSQFVGDTAWAHLDIAGPMSAAKADRWLRPGATGFGARLLARLAESLS